MGQSSTSSGKLDHFGTTFASLLLLFAQQLSQVSAQSSTETGEAEAEEHAEERAAEPTKKDQTVLYAAGAGIALFTLFVLYQHLTRPNEYHEQITVDQIDEKKKAGTKVGAGDGGI